MMSDLGLFRGAMTGVLDRPGMTTNDVITLVQIFLNNDEWTDSLPNDEFDEFILIVNGIFATIKDNLNSKKAARDE